MLELPIKETLTLSEASSQTTANVAPAFIQLATVLRGAKPFKEGNANDTFRGQVILGGGTIKAAIIKDLDPRQLANELMAAALAHAAGLPIPGAHLAVAPQYALAAKKGPPMGENARLVFASCDAQTPPVAQLYQGQDGAGVTKIRERLAQWDGIGDLYGFDSWVANVDRHERNLLFSGETHVWLIDHGHCFTGPNWTPADLDPPSEYNNRLKEWLTPVMSEARRAAVAGAAAELPKKIGGIDLKNIGEINHVASILNAGDFTALMTFLAARAFHVPRLAAAALNLVL